MVIVNYKAGQLANRLFHFSHFIVNSKTYKYKLIYPFFDEYKDFFELDDKDFYSKKIRIRYFSNSFINRKTKKIVNSCMRRYKKNLWLPSFLQVISIDKNDFEDLTFNMRDRDFVTPAQDKILIASGWSYTDGESFSKYASQLRCIFKPKGQFRERIREEIKGLKGNDVVLIGVHIRRGDYKEFNDGRWFYNDRVYVERMEEIVNYFDLKNKSCLFLIASNEKIDVKNFNKINVVWRQRHFIEDLYLLAECDLIIGPPSTFSMWASFYGQIPLFKMEDENKRFNDSELNP